MSHRKHGYLCAPVIALGCAITFVAAGSDNVPKGLSASEWNSIRAEYERNRHAAYRVGTEYHARNAGQQWLTRFDDRGFVLEPNDGGWRWGLALRSYGIAGHERAIGSSAQVTTHKDRVTYAWDNTIEEWFVNEQRGLEHGFTLRQRPAGKGEQLVLRMSVRGGLRPQTQGDGLGMTFLNSEGHTVLQYAGLKVWDADGKTLAARLAVEGEGLRLQFEDGGARYPITIDPLVQQAYVKASNPGAEDDFGWSVAISGDTVVVGAISESSNAVGVNGDQTNNGAPSAGAAYVFVRNAGVWTQQAYLKASNTDATDVFGRSVAISGDTVVVGADLEDSNGTQSDNSAANAGAAYVFVRNAGVWSQQAYLKASNTGAEDRFGISVAISGDTAVVGAEFEDSNALGIDGNGSDNSAANSGAAYVFVRDGTTWTQQAYLKASNTGAEDRFGFSVAVSGDTVVVGASGEGSNATGVNGDQNNNSAFNSGAAYVFVRNVATWTQQAYLKGSDSTSQDLLGYSVAVSGDTVVVGAPNDEDNSGVSNSGVAYIFIRNTGVWTQQAYLKASNTGANDQFGISASISGDTVVVGAQLEDSSTTGVNSTPNEGAVNSGAAYVFVRDGTTWTQQAYVKASNTNMDDRFGFSVAVSGDTVVVGAWGEGSNATGVNGNQSDTSTSATGATYIFTGFTTPCGSGRSMPAGQWTMFSLPCAADAPSTVSSVFSGASGTYDQDWVVWERNESTNSYTKLGLNSPLTQGDGYWFKSLNAAPFSVTGAYTPVTNPSGCQSTVGCFEVTLTKPPTASGLYNLVGNPFPYNVDWSNARVVVNGGTAVTPYQAETNGDLSKTFWIWGGSSYDTFDGATPGMVGQLEATYGFWVKVLDPTLTSIKLLIPSYSNTTGLAGIIKKGALKATEWYVRIVAEAPAEKLKDRGNVLGHLKDSKPGFDSHDLPELAPSFTPYLTVVFPHANWGAKTGDYASDFHAVKTGTDNWNFVVRTDNPARQVRLSWEVNGKAPANMSLRDVKTGKAVALKAGSYTFVMDSKERAFTWSVR